MTNSQLGLPSFGATSSSTPSRAGIEAALAEVRGGPGGGSEHLSRGLEAQPGVC